MKRLALVLMLMTTACVAQTPKKERVTDSNGMYTDTRVCQEKVGGMIYTYPPAKDGVCYDFGSGTVNVNAGPALVMTTTKAKLQAKKQDTGVIVEQSTPPQTSNGQIDASGFLQISPSGLPDIELTLADVISLVSQYTIIHEHSSGMDPNFFGLTFFTLSRINLNGDVSRADAEETLIHELLHAKYHEIGIETGDPISDMLVDQKAQAIYNKLFGLDAARPTPKTDVQLNHAESVK